MFKGKLIASIVMTAFVAVGSLFTAEAAKPAVAPKTALVFAPNNFFEWVKVKLKPSGIAFTQYYKVSDSKVWKEKGYIFPALDELKKYDVVMIFGQRLRTDAKDAFLAYLKEGGTIMMFYTTLTLTKDATNELAFSVAGFDGIKAVHEIPYTLKVKIKHPLKYTKEMGQKRDFIYETVYTIYATYLVDAKALVINSENPELVSVCIAKVGKGRFIYSGTEDIKILADTLKYAGLSAK